eukprot:ANDGO_06246.mRNA.1 Nucleolar protein 12
MLAGGKMAESPFSLAAYLATKAGSQEDAAAASASSTSLAKIFQKSMSTPLQYPSLAMKPKAASESTASAADGAEVKNGNDGDDDDGNGSGETGKPKIRKPRSFSKKQQDRAHSYDSEQDARTVFVSNVPLKLFSTTVLQNHLETQFRQYGTIESVRLRSVAFETPKLPKRAAFKLGQFHESRTSCHAYVVFKAVEEATKALAAANGVDFHGFHLGCSLSTVTKMDRKKSVFVGNLPLDIEDEVLWRLSTDTIGDAGTVTGVRVVRDGKTQIGKGFAFVSFSDSKCVPKMINALHEQETNLNPFVPKEGGFQINPKEYIRPLRVFKTVDEEKAKTITAKAKEKAKTRKRDQERSSRYRQHGGGRNSYRRDDSQESRKRPRSHDDGERRHDNRGPSSSSGSGSGSGIAGRPPYKKSRSS